MVRFMSRVKASKVRAYIGCDQDRNGSLEKADRLVGFKGPSGEHAAHGLTLGPEGMIYCVLGNHTQYDGQYAAWSPYRHYYEGDLVTPPMEDPGGHAAGIKAAWSVVIRTDLEGKRVEIVAGGLRNAYDLVFHTDGSLLVHDSDMEADLGTAWYRPTSLFEIVEGGEYGWRSGWAQMAELLSIACLRCWRPGVVRLQALCVTIIMHSQAYHGSIFLADWSEGRILSVKLQANGAGHRRRGISARTTVKCHRHGGGQRWQPLFLHGRSRHDGWHLPRAVERHHSSSIKNLGTGIARAVRQPQPQLLGLGRNWRLSKKKLGSSWNQLIAGVAYSDDNPAKYRLRAMDLLQLFGPTLTADMLLDLSQSKNELVHCASRASHGSSQRAFCCGTPHSRTGPR